MLEAMKSLNAANLVIIRNVFSSKSMFDDLTNTEEGLAFLGKLQKASVEYNDAWDGLTESLAHHFFLKIFDNKYAEIK